MIFNILNKEDIDSLDNLDLVIVGGGTLGLYISNRISQCNPDLKVGIVEYGNENSTIKYNDQLSESIGIHHSGTSSGRSYGIGGSSTLWGGQLAEFEEKDIENWPIDYETLKNFYKKVYCNLGLENTVEDHIYDKKLNQDGDKEKEIKNIYTRWMREPNFYNYFEDQINQSKKIIVIQNVAAYDIGFNMDKAEKIYCINQTNNFKFHLKAKKFIFACGTLGLNQFFLTTKLTSNVPWKMNQNLGHFFQDHLALSIGTLSIWNENTFRKCFENRWIDGIKIQPKISFKNSERSKFKNGAVLFFSFKSDLEEKIKRIKFIVKNPYYLKSLKNFFRLFEDLFLLRGDLLKLIFKYVFKRRIHALIDKNGLVTVNIQSEQIPISTSRIKIDKRNKLTNGLYKIEVDWRILGEEIESIKHISKIADQYFQRKNIGKINFNLDFFNEKNIVNKFRDTNHQCGGLRMSSIEENGVVDKNLKVWGSRNVWVAGSAVFPSSSHANSTLTALALSEIILDQVLE